MDVAVEAAMDCWSLENPAGGKEVGARPYRS